MATLDQIQARLSAEITRAIEARMRSSGPGPDPATLAAEIEARLLQPASPADEEEPPATCTGLLQDEEPMPTLTDEIKTFIVKGLACYDTPSQVAEAVKAHFDVAITRQHVYAYDPKSSQHMAPRWRELHAATRAALLRETSEIGIAHRAVRLLRLDRLASRSERNNVLTALKCIEMAAKECGGMYENRKPIVLPQPTLPQPALPEPAPQPVAARPAKRRPPAPRPSAPPVIQSPSVPERAAPKPQAASPQRRAPLPEPPLPVMPQPDTPVPAAPQPLAVLAQTPASPALPPSPPLSRVDRYLAYVADRHARDRAVAARALMDSAGISTMPPAS